jgi:hypothetical protein
MRRKKVTEILDTFYVCSDVSTVEECIEKLAEACSCDEICKEEIGIEDYWEIKEWIEENEFEDVEEDFFIIVEDKVYELFSKLEEKAFDGEWIAIVYTDGKLLSAPAESYEEGLKILDKLRYKAKIYESDILIPSDEKEAVEYLINNPSVLRELNYIISDIERRECLERERERMLRRKK